MKDMGYLEEGTNKSTHYGWHCSVSGRGNHSLSESLRHSSGALTKDNSKRSWLLPNNSLIRVLVNINSCFSVAQSCPAPCDPMDCSTLGLPVHHQLPEFTQTHVHWVGDAIQPSHPPTSPSPPALNLSQHQSFFQWVGSSHQVAKVLEFQLQHQSFQWIFRIDWFDLPAVQGDSQESSPAPQFIN